MIESTLRLKDGRDLGYGVYGNPHGIPIIDFHGIPGSRREASLFNEFIGRDDICFIGIDRPGYGCSSPKRNFQIIDFPQDVAALADHLGIERFIGLGYSGGGPFSLACGLLIPERIQVLGIVSGVGPAQVGSAGMHESNRKKFDMAQKLPWLSRLLLKVAFSSLRSDPQKLAGQLSKIWLQMPEPDQLALKDPRFSQGILEVTRDAIANGVTGWANEEVLMALPWQFNLQDIQKTPIFLWHGGKDRNVPVAMAKAAAAQIPGCRATFLDDEGHLSILFNHGKEIITELIQARERRE